MDKLTNEQCSGQGPWLCSGPLHAVPLYAFPAPASSCLWVFTNACTLSTHPEWFCYPSQSTSKLTELCVPLSVVPSLNYISSPAYIIISPWEKRARLIYLSPQRPVHGRCSMKYVIKWTCEYMVGEWTSSSHSISRLAVGVQADWAMLHEWGAF